jgi:hypothetical protein
MLKLLQHLKLVIDHLLVALDVSLEDNLHGNLAGRAIGLTNDSICSSTEGSSELVLGSVMKGIVRILRFGSRKWRGFRIAYFLS